MNDRKHGRSDKESVATPVNITVINTKRTMACFKWWARSIEATSCQSAAIHSAADNVRWTSWIV